MSATYAEAYEARIISVDQSGVANEIEKTYIVSDATDEANAVSTIRSGVAAYESGIPLDSVEISEKIGSTTFKVVARYARSQYYPDSAEEDTPTMSFDCGAGSVHISKSLNQTRIYGTTDAGGMINWNGKTGRDSEIGGVDVPFPYVNLTYTKKMRLTALTAEYLHNIIAIVGCVNNAVWKNWQIGEVMFMGFSYQTPIKGATAVMVTFQFNVKINEVVTISGSTYAKAGQDYMWSMTKGEVSSGQARIAVDSVYIDQTAKRVDFTVLGL